MSCANSDSCVVSCSGNNCDLSCTTGRECRITDCTSGCNLSCNGAEVCENSCDAEDNCLTTP